MENPNGKIKPNGSQITNKTKDSKVELHLPGKQQCSRQYGQTFTVATQANQVQTVGRTRISAIDKDQCK